MKLRHSVLLGLAAFVVMAVLSMGGTPHVATNAAAAPPQGPHGAPEPDMLGVHWAKGQARNASPSGNRNPDLVYHNGAVMGDGTAVTPIYWGSGWAATSENYKVTGLALFYQGVGGSPYMQTNQKNSLSTGVPSATVINHEPFTDTSAAPSHAPKTSEILAEVDKVIDHPVANGYYPVYVDAKRGGAGYCAWHSWGTINDATTGAAVTVQFGFFFNLDGDSGCDPQDTVKPQGLAALANVSGHELSEVATDAHGNAWYDNSGYENADKCAWTFSSSRVVLSNGSSWKIQGNWANLAYDAAHRWGYTKGGCIDGNQNP